MVIGNVKIMGICLQGYQSAEVIKKESLRIINIKTNLDRPI